MVGGSSNAVVAGGVLGIMTNFQSIRDFVGRIKEFVLADEACCMKFI